MYSPPKWPGWLRAVQIGLGALTIVVSIFALAFPGFTYISFQGYDNLAPIHLLS